MMNTTVLSLARMDYALHRKCAFVIKSWEWLLMDFACIEIINE